MDALIPPPRDDDDEDVYLALQTAKALWSRNEREDALRWLRRAAEQASDANADDRALELFKAAAEMASRLQVTAAPSVPPARDVRPSPPHGGGPPPPPNRPPVELAPGPRSGGPPPPPNRPPVELAPSRPPPPGAQASTAPPPPSPHFSSAPPPPPAAPPAAYGAPPGAGVPNAYSPAGYDAGGRPSPPYPSTPAPPPARPAPVPSRPPAPPPSGVSAVPLLRPKNPGGASAQQAQRPPAFTPSAPPVRPAPAQPQVPQVPPGARDVRPSPPRVPPAEAARADDAYRRAGTMLGPAVAPVTGPTAPLGPDYEDESSDAPTKVGRLPPEFQRPAAQARPAQPAVPQAPAPQGAPPPRKARRKTLSRGEQSPLSAGRRPDGRAETRDGRAAQPEARDTRGAALDARDGRDGRGAGAADPRKARDGSARSGQLPSEVPTAPGNDARAGAARAAALRALALADEEVTAQRDIAALHRLKEMRVDDLDEDTSVLPGLKLDASGRAVGPASSGGREGREGRDARQRVFDDDTTRRVSERELAQGLAAIKQAKGSYAATEDDRPTPTDADQELAAAEQDLSATVPPDTSRTSAAGVETAALDSTARYSAIDAAWVTGDHPRGATPVLQSPATVPQPPAPSATSAPSAASSAGAAARAAGAASAQSSAASSRDVERHARATTATSPASPAPAPAAAVPLRAFRVVVLGPDPAAAGAVRVALLGPGARPPAGSTVAMLVPTTETESAELARLFGITD